VRLSPTMLITFGSIVAGLIIWTATVHSGLVSTRFTPSPFDILREFGILMREGYVGTPLYEHIGASLIRTVIGFSAAVICGIPVGLLIGRVKTLEAASAPWFAFLRPIPAIAFVPLVILWFGIGEFFEDFRHFLFVFSLHHRLHSSRSEISTSSLGALDHKSFFYVVLPAALPQIMTGVRIGSALSWTLVVAAELVAAQKGLGYMIMDASTFFRVKDVYVGLIMIGIIGFLLEGTIALVEGRVVHWRGK
jgi:ABC-type nitrate/sulfonate/bicarbonate transport system permease component